jgi:hypothetical protein
MPSPLSEFEAQIDGLKVDFDFVRLASQLRRRIGSILQWQAQGEDTELAKKFIRTTFSGPEGMYGPLLVRLLACLEQYLRKSIASAVIRKAQKAKSYEDLAETLRNRNLILTGRLLSMLETPREYLKLNVDEMIENLASCNKGSSSFRLNAQAFSATLASVNPVVIEKAFEYVDICNWWDTIGANPRTAALLGTKGNRATGIRVKDRLKELARLRNHLAHGGEGQIVISDSQLSDAIEFTLAFAKALDAVVQHC